MNNKHKLIGVCGTGLFQQDLIRFLTSLREVSLQNGYTTIAFSASVNSAFEKDSALGESKLLDLIKYIDLDCMIILTETIKNPDLIKKIVKLCNIKNIPVFSIDGHIDGCYNLLLDYKTGFRNLVEHVVCGHAAKRVNMLAGVKGNSFSDERIAIYKEVLAENGIEFEEERLGYGDFWERPSYQAMQKFMDSNLPTPDAIICANDSMAITACSALAERGYKVPEDVIVTGFDGIQSGRYNSPSITTCAPNYTEAVEFIMEQVSIIRETGILSPCDHMINYTMLKSQSCGCKSLMESSHSKVISELFDAVNDSTWHTEAMNTLVTNLLTGQCIEDIIRMLPETVKLWNDHFRFACIKSELTGNNISLEHCKNTTGKFGKMTVMLHTSEQVFSKAHEQFKVNDFIPDFDSLIKKPGTTFIVRLLSSGKQVYGYTVDEFNTLDHRKVQQCNEFAMFLTHSINTVLHNYVLNQVNRTLEKAYDDIAQLSLKDPMTGIYNRRGFFQIITDIINDKCNIGKYLYIMCIDLDDLKKINDNYGHDEGDFAITSLAHSLCTIKKDGLICSRFGGDEYTCAFLANNDNDCDIQSIRGQITAALGQIPGIHDKAYSVGFSIGASSQLIGDDMNIESLISSADKEMYADKIARKKA